MTNILPFTTSVSGTGLNERFSGVSARADNISQGNEVAKTLDIVGARDNVSIKAGAQVTASAIGKIDIAGGLREVSSLLQVADAGLVRMDRKLDEMRALAEVAATAPMGTFDRVVLNDAFQELMGEADGIARDTEFNGKNPLAGYSQEVDLGDGKEPMELLLPSMRIGEFAPELAGDDLMSQENALKSIRDIDAAKQTIADVREDIFSMQTLISAALMGGGGGSMALDTIQGFGDQIDVGAEIARAISREVVLEALLPRDRPRNSTPPAGAADD